MYSKQLEDLMEAILADGIITEKERAVLHRKAIEEGIDLDEIDVVIDGRLAAKQNQSGANAVSPTVAAPPMAGARREVRHRFGEVFNCPNCNAVVPSGTARCEECGFEFRNIEAVNSVQKFSDAINAIENRFLNSKDDDVKEENRRNAIVSAISNFPVPNSKEDLLEFIIFTESKFKHLSANSDTNHAIRKAYKAKYCECVDKANIYFNTDPQFQHIFSQYPKNKKREWKDLNEDSRSLIVWGLIMVVMMIIGLIAGLVAG